ncbi:MAG: SDR family oxidoreductase [candidate division NC10 bacterium]
MDIRLDDRVALVTGASSGIGQAAALALAEAGAHVVVQGHSHMVELEALADRIVRLGRRAVVVRADVTSTADVDRMVQTAVDELGGVDIAFNNYMAEQAGAPGDREAGKRLLAKSYPLGRLGQASDVATAVVYLASDAADFVTGQIMFVDGGYSVW